MIYQVVYPITTSIYGDTFKEAIKNYIKLNHNLNISQMVVTDQTNHMQANIKYYQQDGRNRVGINMFPTSNTWPSMMVVNNDTYVPQNIMPIPSVAAVVTAPSPFMPLQTNVINSSFFPLSPISPVSPFVPLVPRIYDGTSGL
jgi:hypothetical protein